MSAPTMTRHTELEAAHAARVRQGRVRPLAEHDAVPGCACPRCVLLSVARMGGVTAAAIDVCMQSILPELARRIPLERTAVAERLRDEWIGATGTKFPSASLLAALAARIPGAREEPAPVAHDSGTLPVEEARAVSILDVCARVGIPLKRSGKRWRGSCPFHTSRSGTSFSVDPDRGLWFCFGCQFGGDTIDLLARAEGLEFPEAVRELARMPRRRQAS